MDLTTIHGSVKDIKIKADGSMEIKYGCQAVDFLCPAVMDAGFSTVKAKLVIYQPQTALALDKQEGAKAGDNGQMSIEEPLAWRCPKCPAQYTETAATEHEGKCRFDGAELERMESIEPMPWMCDTCGAQCTADALSDRAEDDKRCPVATCEGHLIPADPAPRRPKRTTTKRPRRAG